MTWRTGPNDAAVTTTSASRTADRASGATATSPIPVGRPRGVGQRRGALRMAIEQRQRHPGKQPAEHGQVAPTLDAGADERGARRPTGDGRREPADGDPGDSRGPRAP